MRSILGAGPERSSATGLQPCSRPTRSAHAQQPLKSSAFPEVAWSYASAHVASFASRYPKALAASVSIGLAGFAAFEERQVAMLNSKKIITGPRRKATQSSGGRPNVRTPKGCGCR